MAVGSRSLGRVVLPWLRAYLVERAEQEGESLANRPRRWLMVVAVLMEAFTSALHCVTPSSLQLWVLVALPVAVLLTPPLSSNAPNYPLVVVAVVVERAQLQTGLSLACLHSRSSGASYLATLELTRQPK